MKKQIIEGSDLYGKKLEIQEDGSLRIIKNKGRFMPKENDGFYFLNNFGSITRVNYHSNNSSYRWLINHNLVFRTEEECEEYKQYLELLDEYSFDPNWNDISQKKWHIGYNGIKNYIHYNYQNHLQHQAHYFPFEICAKEFVEKAGESNVKKFMFDIWEE